MVAMQRHQAISCLVRTLCALIFCTTFMACRASTPTPPPRPTPLPSPTPGIDQVLKDSLFTITFNDMLIAAEEIRVERAERQLLIYSELRSFVDFPETHRRTMVLAGGLDAQRYDLEVTALGARSTWVAERRGDVMDCLNNNLGWFAPVLVEGIVPAPSVLLESSPSALPFALLALRFYEADGQRKAESPLYLRSLDVLEDYPVSRALTVTVDPNRKGAVIGTLALEGRLEGGINPRFTMWVRPANRVLYGVEVSDYRFNIWFGRTHPALSRTGKLVIQRVSKLPDAPPPATKAPDVRRIALDFNGADSRRRSGTLLLPTGSGPFPCLVAHSAGGIVPRWEIESFVRRGWAVYAYGKRGLDQSEGTFERDAPKALAQDAVLAAAMLRQRAEVDPRRVVFLGLDQAGLVGALALSSGGEYAGAVLGSCAVGGPAFPTWAQQRIRRALASFYGWSADRVGAYEAASVRRWQEWLFGSGDEVTLLRRRVSLRPLKEWTDVDLAKALSQTKAPILLLQGQADSWSPVDEARALHKRLVGAGQQNVQLRVFDKLGTDLGASETKGALAPEVEEALFGWLARTFPQ